MEVKVPCPLFEVEVNVCPVPSLLLLELELADDVSAKATKSSETSAYAISRKRSLIFLRVLEQHYSRFISISE